MTLEMDDNTYNVAIGTLLVVMLLGALLIITSCVKHDTDAETERAKSGLIQKQNVGSTGTHWTEP